MNYVLLRHNFPPVIIKSTDKKNYLFALNQADAGDVNAFIEYVVEETVWSLELSIKAARGESLDEDGDLNKKVFLLKKKLGKDPNETVQITYNSEAIERVINETIIPLAFAWEKKLLQFDTFFMSRNMGFSGSGFSFTLQHFNEKLKVVCKQLLENKLLIQTIEIMKLICLPFGFRSINNSMGINGGEINIYFHHNAYELTYTNEDKIINRLYHQPLNEDEINKISESLGTFLYNNIEQILEANKSN